MKKITYLVLVFFILLPTQVGAEETAPMQEVLDKTLAIAEDVYAPGIDFAKTTKDAVEGKLSFRLDSVLSYLTNLLTKELRDNASLLIKMVALAILAGVLCTLGYGAPKEGVSDISFLACFALIAGLSLSLIADIHDLASSTIENMMLFIAGLMPVMSSLVLATDIVAFAGFYPSLFVAMQAFVTICKSFFMPLIMVISALSVVNAVSNRFHISRLIDVARQIVKWGLGLLLTIFVGVLSIHSFSAVATTGIAKRTAKYALCSLVPLVGNVLAESAEAVISSVRVIRGAIGVVGCLSLLSLICMPLIKILVSSFLYRFAAGVSEPATDKRIVQLFMDLSGSITLIFSILLMVSVMFIISIALLCVLIL